VVGLYDVVDALPPAAQELVAQLGVVRSVEQLLAGEPEALVDLLDRLGDPAREVSRAQLHQLYGAACAALARSGRPRRPAADRGGAWDRPRASIVSVAPGDAVLVDMPDLLPLVGARPVVPIALSLADQAHQVLEVPLATGLSSYDVRSAAVATPRWGDLPGFAAAVSRLGLDNDPVAHLLAESSYEEHEVLEVVDASGAQVRVPWRLVGGGAVLSRADFVHGASRALAALLAGGPTGTPSPRCWPTRPRGRAARRGRAGLTLLESTGQAGGLLRMSSPAETRSRPCARRRRVPQQPEQAEADAAERHRVPPQQALALQPGPQRDQHDEKDHPGDRPDRHRAHVVGLHRGRIATAVRISASSRSSSDLSHER
jgi:hypothetical protein